jgi:F-type H+-transporting ATPase subunit delta
MFFADRWALAFTSALDAVWGDSGKTGQIEACRNLEEGLDNLKFFVPRIKKIPGRISGRGTALHIEAMLRSAAGLDRRSVPQAAPDKHESGDNVPLEDRRVEFVIRFISLLIRKNSFKHADTVIRKIETILDKRKGVLQISLETVFPLEDDFEERLKSMIRQKTGVAEIRLKTRENPALLGGYRLIIGSSLIDTSVATLLQKMAADLSLPDQMNIAGGF